MKKEILKLKEITSLRDITYKQFKEFEDIITTADTYQNDSDKEQYITFNVLKLFYNIDKQTVRNLSLEQTEMLLSKVLCVLNEKPELQNIILMNEKKYGLIPNFSKIKTGELIDLDNLLKEDKWTEIFSILYRPLIGDVNKRGEYRIEDYQGYDDKFKDIDAYTAIGCISFFYKSFQILNHSTQLSTVK